MKTELFHIFKNQYFIFFIAIAVGVLIGKTLLKAIFKKLEESAKIKQFRYSQVLFTSLYNISFLLGVFVVVNASLLLPFEITYGSWYRQFRISLNVIIISYLIAEVLIYLYDSYTKSKSGKATSLYHIIIRILTYIAGIIVLSNLIGFELAPLLTALGVSGLAVALALQDTLGNLFSGMHILAAKQLQPGDYIKLDSGEEGYVLDINWRNTMIKTLLENVVIIPNSKISSTITTNFFTLQKNHFFQIIVGVHYDSDLEQVEQVTLEVARQVLSEFPPLPNLFEPSVRFFEFADSSINMKVWLATDVYENQFKIRHIFIQRLQKRFKEEGIVIPFPIRTLEISSSSLKHLKED